MVYPKKSIILVARNVGGFGEESVIKRMEKSTYDQTFLDADLLPDHLGIKDNPIFLSQAGPHCTRDTILISGWSSLH